MAQVDTVVTFIYRTRHSQGQWKYGKGTSCGRYPFGQRKYAQSRTFNPLPKPRTDIQISVQIRLSKSPTTDGFGIYVSFLFRVYTHLLVGELHVGPSWWVLEFIEQGGIPKGNTGLVTKKESFERGAGESKSEQYVWLASTRD